VHAKADTSKLKIDLPFDVEFFNGAPHAGAVIVPIPTVWRNGDFRQIFPYWSSGPCLTDSHHSLS
jgi:hypothetical protein